LWKSSIVMQLTKNVEIAKIANIENAIIHKNRLKCKIKKIRPEATKNATPSPSPQSRPCLSTGERPSETGEVCTNIMTNEKPSTPPQHHFSHPASALCKVPKRPGDPRGIRGGLPFLRGKPLQTQRALRLSADIVNKSYELRQLPRTDCDEGKKLAPEVDFFQGLRARTATLWTKTNKRTSNAPPSPRIFTFSED